MRLNLWIICSAVALVAGASHINAQQPGGLTRAAAAALIAKDPRFATASVLSLASPEQSVKAGVAEGLWVEENFGRLELADAGRRYFTQAAAFPNYTVVLVEPARREVIDVISVASAPTGANLSEVRFRWRYVGLPPVVARYTGQSGAAHQSKAFVRLSGEGWRVEQLTLTESGRSRFGAASADVARKDASDAQRFLERLQQSTRPSRQLGTFVWPDHKATISDTGFKLEGSPSLSCYWFGQVDRVEVANGADASKRTGSRKIIVWRRDSIPPITIEASRTEAGEFAAFSTTLASAQRTWAAKYPQIGARLKAVSRTASFVDLAKQGREGWYDEESKTVACDEAFVPQSTAQMPAGLKVGSKWVGSIENIGAIQLQITSISTAVIIYNGVRETLELQVGNDDIVLRGVAYDIVSGGDRIFKLDTFRGRLSEDQQGIAGTWSDAGTGKGRWSAALVKP